MVSFFLKLELSAFALKGNSDFGALMASVDNEVAAFPGIFRQKCFVNVVCMCVCVCLCGFLKFHPHRKKKADQFRQT